MAMSFRSGYFSRSSPQAIAPDWYVVLRPEEKPMKSELRDVDGARGGAFAVAELVVKFSEADLTAVEIVGVCMFPDQNVQRQDGKIELVRQCLRQIAGGVGDDLKTFFHV